jgi:hypothetical protein
MATSRHIPEPKSSPSQKDRRQFKQKETKVTKVRKPSSLAPLSVAASVPEFSTPIFLCCLCYLLFQFSLFPSVECECHQTVPTPQKERRQFEQKETKVTKVRRSYSRAPLSLAASVPEFPTPISLCYLCYLLFKFSSFSSVECECCPDRNHITEGQKTI